MLCWIHHTQNLLLENIYTSYNFSRNNQAEPLTGQLLPASAASSQGPSAAGKKLANKIQLKSPYEAPYTSLEGKYIPEFRNLQLTSQHEGPF